MIISFSVTGIIFLRKMNGAFFLVAFFVLIAKAEVLYFI